MDSLTNLYKKKRLDWGCLEELATPVKRLLREFSLGYVRLGWEDLAPQAEVFT